MALDPAAFPQVAIQRSSTSLVWLSTPSGTSLCMLAESMAAPSRHNDRCTLGIVVKLQTSCFSPFLVITKQNDPTAAAYLCVSGVTVQCSSLDRDLGGTLSFRSPDFVHCTRRCTHCLHPLSWEWQLVLARWLLVLDVFFLCGPYVTKYSRH